MGRAVSAPASRASVTAPSRQSMPRLVVPQVGCDRLGRHRAGQPQPAFVVLAGPVLLPERLERSSERRHAGRVAFGEPRRQPIQEKVDRAWRPRSRPRGARGLGGVLHGAGTGEPTDEDRCSERFEVGLTRQGRHRTARGAWPRRAAMPERRSARAGERDLCAQPVEARALELVERSDRGGREELERCRVRRRRTWPARPPAPAPPRAGSGVSSVARSRKRPPPRRRRGSRALGRALQLAGQSSSGSDAACARCHARRSGSTAASVASASARWTSCRSATAAAR